MAPNASTGSSGTQIYKCRLQNLCHRWLLGGNSLHITTLGEMTYKQIFISRFLINYVIFLHQTEKVTFGAIAELLLLANADFYLRCKACSPIKKKKVRRNGEQQQHTVPASLSVLQRNTPVKKEKHSLCLKAAFYLQFHKFSSVWFRWSQTNNKSQNLTRD